MKILLATSNRHKMKELAALLPGVALASPEDLGIPFAPEDARLVVF